MKPAILIVLDGWGIAPAGPGNAITLAKPTNYNSFLHSFPSTTLNASGEAVGLPAQEVGNTEVGHLNLGAGRIVYQDLPRINLSIADGSFYKNPALLSTLQHLDKTGGKLHLIGLISQGTVHSSLEHLHALLYFAKENNLKQVYIHAITDGRDSPPQSAMETIGRVQERLAHLGVGKIATVMGRYFAMDRDRRWERTEKAYNCLINGDGMHIPSVEAAIKHAYSHNRTDEFILPKNIVEDGKPIGLIEEGDAVVYFNFRIDRPRQLTKAFVLSNFEDVANTNLSFDPYAVKYFKTHHPKEEIQRKPFKRSKKFNNLKFVTMTEYEKNLPIEIVFPPNVVEIPLGKVLADSGVSQLRMSESEKERFVTFYFNGQNEETYLNEDRLIVPSPKVATYDTKPQMSAYELTEIAISKIHENKYSFILINFANPDMVGHTGNIEATVKAITAVDSCLGKIKTAAFNNSYAVFITADHGNAEQKINPKTGGISTEHTANQVPFIVMNKVLEGKGVGIQPGILGDVAPTILSYMGIIKPSKMTGRDLLSGFWQ